MAARLEPARSIESVLGAPPFRPAANTVGSLIGALRGPTDSLTGDGKALAVP
ncbi:hypothetical protein [Streptomyces hirsutus]|uniref:hypothetical protein n=1 Tax=Streptomyces hirsutus TaxID=35620 RepID=UPI0012FEB8A0|nr:hypothetical protein [Streptomyces hirsutus]